MGFVGILALACGVAMDATAVAAATGLAARRVRIRDAVSVAAYFGGFQALMPLLGWHLGNLLGPVVTRWDHWIAFVLLVGVGGKMLWDARIAARADRADANLDGEKAGGLFGFRHMITLAFATSIDAFAVGVTLPMVNAPLIPSVVTMGVTTALLSAAGLVAGRRFGAILGPRLDAIGGAILVGLGIKILIQHLTAH